MIRKQIVGFSNYEVSECGRVFSLRRKHNQSDIYDETEIELKVQHIDDAYCILGLTSDEGKRHMKSVHRLVAEAFIENPESKRTVNHKDGDKHNNSKSNLEWATYAENSQHAHDTGLNRKKSGETNGMSKLKETECINLIIDMLDGANNDELGEYYDIHPRYVSLIRGKKRWKHLWEGIFKDETPPTSHKQYPNELDATTQLIIINRILQGEKLKTLAEEYSIDKSILSRVKNNQTWKHAYQLLNKQNAQRLSKAPHVEGSK